MSNAQNILFIGHKLQELEGFVDCLLYQQIKDIIRSKIEEHKADNCRIISSLNLGIETWAIEEAWQQRVPYEIYIPFDNFHMNWPHPSRRNYVELMKHASNKIQVAEGNYEYKKLFAKDQKLIEDADIIYGFYNTFGLMGNLARRANKEIINLMPEQDDMIEI